MPLETYSRGAAWWVKGRIEYNGLAITDYYRCSTGASSEAGATNWIESETQRQIRRHVLGDEAYLTFSDAVMLYAAKPKEAGYLLKVLPHIGNVLLRELTPQVILDLGSKVYPKSCTDTWRRQIVSPVSAVINRAHRLGKCPPIRVGGYSARDRQTQDAKRGEPSRVTRTPGSWDWIRSVQPHTNPYVAAGLEMMFETGCRIGQLIALRPKDLDLKNAKVWIIAQKGHPAQWIDISDGMVVTLANLPPRRPHNRRDGYVLGLRVFGYADRTGFTAELRRACVRANVKYLSPHQAGRHGFYTELRVRLGVDPITAASAGRWSNAALPDRVYAHSETDQREIRERIRTGAVQDTPKVKVKSLKKKKKS